jgi:hypothetical protein
LVCYLVALVVYAAGVYTLAPAPHDWPLLTNPDTLLTITAGLVATLALWAASHLTHHHTHPGERTDGARGTAQAGRHDHRPAGDETHLRPG